MSEITAMNANSMLPNTEHLVTAICESLDEVARADDRVRGNWTNAICTAVERRLDVISGEIGVCFGHERSKPKEEREFLFDFTAFILDNEPGFADWYTMQALIVGEIEFNGDLGRDFEKLMFADSAVCFFVFPDSIKELRPVDELDFFSKVAQKRIRSVSARGNVPPVFVIASYSGEHRRFMTRVIRHEPH